MKLVPLLLSCAMLLSSCVALGDNFIGQDKNTHDELNTDGLLESGIKLETAPDTSDTPTTSEPTSDPDPTPEPNPEPKPDPQPDPNPDPTPTPTPTPNEPAIEICDHLFDEWVEKTPAKCLGVAGLRERECTKCGDVEQESIYVEGHINVVVDKAKDATCTATGLTEGRHCEACDTVIDPQITVPLKNHTYDNDEDDTCNLCPHKREVACKHPNTKKLDGKPASCTESGLSDGVQCIKCGDILLEQKIISAYGHSPEVLKGYAATDDEWGLTDGSRCSTCKVVLIEQTAIFPTGYGNAERYESNYAYNSLADMTNGAKLQRFYNAIGECADQFHTKTSINAKRTSTGNGYIYIVGSFKPSDYGITMDEAALVWSFFRHDHPLYYWYAGNYAYTATDIYLLSGASYANGNARAEYNKLIIESVSKYIALVQGETSPYRIALAFHDAIITEINYAYKSDGITPEDADWAHSILGVFEKKSGVCESYAKTFQLLLNYCEIENVYVTGRSNGENHAWNMARMDDGKWYWFDLTWDDKPEWMLGIVYNYFCVNDTQNLSWTDGPWVYDTSSSFSTTHTAFDINSSGLYKQYALPSRSASVADFDSVMLRETFTVGGFKYAVIGYNSVQLVGIQGKTNADIPESVTYGGVTYNVVAIGAISGTLLQSGNIEIVGFSLKTVNIPESVVFIWDNALTISTLTAINVDEDNSVYESVDGVLFTESLYTLIQYPLGNTATSYTVPDATAEIANMSFGNGRSYGRLRLLVLGKSVAIVGSMNAGYGYRDSANDGTLYSSNGDFFYIIEFMNLQGSIEIDEDNPNFIIEEGALYNEDKTVLYLLLDRTLTSFTCADSVKIIDVGAFYSCRNLKTLVLPSTLSEIRVYAMGSCSFTSLKFNGSSAQWNAVKKASGWDYSSRGCSPEFAE